MFDPCKLSMVIMEYFKITECKFRMVWKLSVIYVGLVSDVW